MIRSVLNRASLARAISTKTVAAPRILGSMQVPSVRSFHATSRSESDKDVTPGIIDKYQLYEPSRYVPLGLGFFGTLSATGLYHWNEESQLLGLFVLFVGTVYSKGGDMIGNMLKEMGDQILEEHNALEDQVVEVMRAKKEAQIASLNDFQEFVALTEECIAKGENLTAVHSNIALEKVNSQIERMLQIYVNNEGKLQQETESAIVDYAAEFVSGKFEADPKLQEEAMKAAFAVLKDPSAKAEKDVVGELFSSFFEEFRAKAWEDKAANDTVELSSKVAGDISTLKSQLVGAVEGVEGASDLFVEPGKSYSFSKDGLDGAVFNADLASDARYQAAAADNKRYMSKDAFAAWEKENASLATKQI